MKKYKTCTWLDSHIVEIEINRETEKCVFYSIEYCGKTERSIEYARESLIDAEIDLKKILKLKRN